MKKNSARQEIGYLRKRIDSQSKRICKLQTKLAQIIENHRYYVKKRLPQVLERENIRKSFTDELKRARSILKGFGKQRLVALSNSNDEEKRKSRYIGMFTHVEMQRLRSLLSKNLRIFSDKNIQNNS